MPISRRSSNGSSVKKLNPSEDDGRAREQFLFTKSKEYLKPSRIFRAATCLYAERKLVLFLSVHFIITATVWGKSEPVHVDTSASLV